MASVAAVGVSVSFAASVVAAAACSVAKGVSGASSSAACSIVVESSVSEDSEEFSFYGLFPF